MNASPPSNRSWLGLRRADSDVLALCVSAGLDYTVAAAALGVPVGTVRSRLSRARRRLNERARTDRAASPAGLRLAQTGTMFPDGRHRSC
jgi:RNA polymerase sigma-70 factor (ECF subfamily)